MAVTKHWYPGTRQGQLDLGLLWIDVLPEETKNEKGEAVKKWQAWAIPQAVFTDFGTKFAAAQEALTEAKNDEKRTKVVNQKVATAFRELAAAMRAMKKRYFHIPPLTEADYVSLGLSLPDATHTVSGTPEAQVTIETYLVGRHQLGLRFLYVSGNPDDPANKVFRVYYKVVAAGEKPPEKPLELTLSFPERRKTCIQDFDFGDSGKTVYYCVQIENGSRKGPWGPLVSALIP